MRSWTKRRLVLGGAAALLVVGGGGAVAATQANSPREESQAVIDDAAKQLGVPSNELSDALEKALSNRVDAAVADGRLTQEQADRIKARIQSGEAPLVFGGGHRGAFRHGHGPRLGGHHGLDAAASYLGLTESELRTELGSGKTLAQVAQAKGKSVDGLVDALVADAKEHLDAAVAAARLTQERADQVLANIRERVGAHVNGERRERFRPGGPSFFAPPPIAGPAA